MRHGLGSLCATSGAGDSVCSIPHVANVRAETSPFVVPQGSHVIEPQRLFPQWVSSR